MNPDPVLFEEWDTNTGIDWWDRNRMKMNNLIIRLNDFTRRYFGSNAKYVHSSWKKLWLEEINLTRRSLEGIGDYEKDLSAIEEYIKSFPTKSRDESNFNHYDY